MKIFCLHHAGGNGYIYYQWRKYLKEYEIIPLDLPGHGIRINEQLLYDLDVAVSDLYKQITSRITEDEQYVLFGHSMGGLFILYILERLKQNCVQMPNLVILSGASTPNEEPDRKPVSDMSEDEFIDMIYSQGGTDKSLLQSKEFRECFLPIIRADYMILDQKKIFYMNERFNVRATIFNGRDDLSARKCEEKLKEYFEETVPVIYFEGNHFYFESHIQYLCKEVEEAIINNL